MPFRTPIAPLAGLVLCLLASGPVTAAAFGAGDPILVRTAEETSRLGVAVGGRTGARGGGVAARLSLRLATKGDSTTLWIDAQRDRLERDGVAFGRRVETESVDTDIGLGLLRRLDREPRGIALGLRVAASVAEREVLDPLVVGGRRTRGTVSSESLSVALAGRAEPLGGTPLRPYGHVGLALERRAVELDVDGAGNADRDLDETDFRLGPDAALGIALPLGRFLLFAALEYREEASVGAGVRLGL